ncbi:hypothetical protein COT44_02975 [Candidatus Shapirobacteria bacterium CG08_land_8_20_14_0_20_39_18]|uniref:Uncharacterized protein n=1 Tax=Candidatus Shapirobacteria bacterium CG08_land_8_20_14_0_20_39_18 TaxID=1974883 RepID=A0A2M6XCH5_9BACT|nr:MAG: hypothetical protein COT44_02975 [Candidatus Shapirobacteria bacterium CG08_land_8_20_14_0_20_39_18]PIY66479.1 MAG: hypothetical protein COY91_00090 [Candidatus Shapirobacteria bacterium CG_4_10_14_0_8_um_filter_39_15]
MALSWKQEYHRYHRYFINLNSLYQKKEVIVYTGLTLSIFTVAFFVLFALKPAISTIFSLVSEINTKKELDQKLQTKINDITQAQNNYNTNSQTITLVDEALPTDPSMEGFAWYLETLFQQEGLTIKNIDYDPVDFINKPPAKILPTNTELKEVNFSFKTAGVYENLKDTLNKLENLRRLVIIDSFSLGQAGTEDLQTLNLSVNGRILYLPLTK